MFLSGSMAREKCYVGNTFHHCPRIPVADSPGGDRCVAVGVICSGRKNIPAEAASACLLRGLTAECDYLLNAFFLREKRKLVCFDAAERGGVTNFASVFVAMLNGMEFG
jgi:hypothetical protein